MKIWVTKYALTTGVLIEEAEISGTMAQVKNGVYYTYYHNSEWHLTRESAVSQVRKMITNKRRSLQKQFEKLNLLDVNFVIP